MRQPSPLMANIGCGFLFGIFFFFGLPWLINLAFGPFG